MVVCCLVEEKIIPIPSQVGILIQTSWYVLGQMKMTQHFCALFCITYIIIYVYGGVYLHKYVTNAYIFMKLPIVGKKHCEQENTKLD